MRPALSPANAAVIFLRTIVWYTRLPQ
jgi:hypothetical protein